MRTRTLLSVTLITAAATAYVGVGCSSSSEDGAGPGGEVGCLSDRQFLQRNAWGSFLDSKCAKCHTPDGIAVTEHKARFVIQPASYPGFLDANLTKLREVVKYEYDGKPLILQKATGAMPHIGGKQIEPGSEEFKVLEQLVTRLRGASTCVAPPNNLLEKVENLDAVGTLRKMTIDLGSRLPTQAEIDQVKAGGDGALDGILDALMKEEPFLNRVRDFYADLMLTDRGLAYSGAAIDFTGDKDWPGLKPYKDSTTAEYKSAKRPLINAAIAREPLDIIAYVVKNDKPFSEILTADYTVVNPYSAEAFGVLGSVSFKDPTNAYDFQPAKLTQTGATPVLLPHAGILTTSSFLNRWQTTPTNRNRARARRVFKFFLATDVLRLAERPIDATKVTNKENPTQNSELCNVCHKVLDPVAGAFRGYNDYDYEHFEPTAPWHDDMFHPGFGDKDMDTASYGKGLQWLSKEVVADPRFRISVVHAVYTGLTGRTPMGFPSNAAGADYQSRIVAWEAQDDFFKQVADAFVDKNAMNLKSIVKAIVKSPYYRGIGVKSGSPETFAEIGIGQRLGPEALNRKITAVMGFHFRKPYDWEKEHDWLLEDYKIPFGGMDSDTVTERTKSTNTLMAKVGKRMSNEMSCRAVAWDFTKEKASRRFFPNVNLDVVPESAGKPVDGSVTDIKANIVHLHKLVLGEELPVGNPEIERTYTVFLETWRELSAAGTKDDLMWDCQGRWDPNTGKDLLDATRVTNDKTRVVRAWMSVMTYLLSDFKFLHH